MTESQTAVAGDTAAVSITPIHYFQAAEPLSRENFLTVYRESVLLSQLLFAPFGISEAAVQLLGESDCIEMYTSMFQQVENIVSRRLFILKHYEEDRIIASMSKYIMGGNKGAGSIDDEPDKEIVQEMQAASKALLHMLRPPPAVEFLQQEVGSCIATAETAALLLHRVISSIRAVLFGDSLYLQEQGGDSNSDSKEARATIGAVDSALLLRLGVEVAVEDTTSPTRLFCTQPALQLQSFRSAQAVQAALDSISAVPITAVLAANNSTCTMGNHVADNAGVVNFSILQYHALLNLFGRSAPVKKVLQQHCDWSSSGEGFPVPALTVDQLRAGAYLRHVNLSLVPVVAFTEQLSAILSALEGALQEAMAASDTPEAQAQQQLLRSRLELCAAADSFAKSALKTRKEAQSAAVIGDFQSAVQLLSEGLLDLLTSEENEKDEICSESLHPLLPVQFKVQLHTDRASFSVQAGDLEAALRDIDAAIAYDKFCSAAYSIRSQLQLHRLQLVREANAEDGTDANTDAAAEVEAAELRAAAADALLAFLQDGAADLNLAAAAEEVARDLCRSTAKQIFQERNRSSSEGNVIIEAPTSVGAAAVPAVAVSTDESSVKSSSFAVGSDNLPRSWLVGSYFAAYDHLSTALGTYYDSIQQCSAQHSPEIASAAIATSFAVESETAGLDIDESNRTDCDFSEQLPAPPQHLISEECNSNSAATTAIATAGELDRFAYLLLVVLVEAFESVTYDQQQKQDMDELQYRLCRLQLSEKSIPILCRESRSDPSSSKPWKCAADILSTFRQSSTLPAEMQRQQHEQQQVEQAIEIEYISEGKCGQTQYASSADRSAVIQSTAVPPCSWYSWALRLLRGQQSGDCEGAESDTDTDSDSCSNDCNGGDNCSVSAVEVLMIKRFGQRAVALLRGLKPAAVERITGVRFARDGTVLHLDESHTADDIDATGSDAGITPVTEAVDNCDVAHRLRARLLNICGSVAYLAGDALGAVRCFKTSMKHDAELLDSEIKLGSLLVDMDEPSEAAQLLQSALQKAPSSATILLHLAELDISQSAFEGALKHLRQAMRLTDSAVQSSSEAVASTSAVDAAHFGAKILQQLLTSTSLQQQQQQQQQQCMIEKFTGRVRQAAVEAAANVYSLLGVTLFRANPSRPEIALETLKRAVRKFTAAQQESPILLLCCGEVYSQGGDVVNALQCFKRAHVLAPRNPLTFVNAARTYQQLGQLQAAQQHLQAALRLDPAMAMVRVDLAQNLLLSGRAAQALQLINEALLLAKQVSEIKDVLTARTVAEMQQDFERRKMYAPPPSLLTQRADVAAVAELPAKSTHTSTCSNG